MGEALEIMGELSRLRDIDHTNTKFINDMLKKYRLWREGQIDFNNIKFQDQNCKTFIINYDCKEINQARRQVTHFFITAFEMFSEAKALDKACFKKICKLDSFKLLYHVVEWFEFTHAINWQFDPKGKCIKLLEQSGRDDIEDLKKLRPPGKYWADIKQMAAAQTAPE